jgi:YggT family protein
VTVPLATVRDDVATFVGTLITVYVFIIIAYIVVNLLEAFGVRIPYSRPVSAIRGFLHDTVEPYLGIFRRFIPPVGPLDLSPMVGIVLLFVLQGILVGVIRG